MSSVKRYIMKHDCTEAEFLSLVEKEFHTSFIKSTSTRLSLYDTFDWRLYKNNNFFLTIEPDAIRLLDRTSDRVKYENVNRQRFEFLFSWDFFDAELKHLLRKMMGVRALVKIVDFEEHLDIFNILNDDEKKIAELCLIKMSRILPEGGQNQLRCFEFVPLRGYSRELKDLRRRAAQLYSVKTTSSFIEEFIRELGIFPGGYTTKVKITLMPDERCSSAMKRIFIKMLYVMKQNQNGIKQDIDTEFLHDFRIAVRRTRSALGQIQYLFPEPQFSRFRRDFGRLGKVTNHLRDLDVYLLRQNEYLKMLPKELRPGLLTFFDSIKKERQREFLSVLDYLKSDDYNSLLTDWHCFLHSEQKNDALMKNAARAILPVAKENLAHRFNQIVKLGNKTDLQTSDEQLHRLRIHCKKLRYLLEFFDSLFQKSVIEKFINQLKVLQDALGEFNDLFIQFEQMKVRLNVLLNSDESCTAQAAALGGLLTLLSNKQGEVRSRSITALKKFLSQKNRALFQMIVK